MSPSSLSLEHYRAVCLRKKELTKTLCDALYAWLVADIEACLEAPQVKYHESSLEDLNKAQVSIDEIEAQLEAVEQTTEEHPEISGIATMMVPMLRTQLRQAIDWRDQLQKAIQATEEASA